MHLTAPNAAGDLDHREAAPPSRGYGRTGHHAGYVKVSDLWRPGPGGQPHTVTGVVPHNGYVTPTHQYRAAYRYPTDGPIPTAVPDPIATVLVHLRQAD